RAEEGGRLVARFARLDVPPDSGASGGERALNPAELPTVDFVAERFSVRGKALGRVELAAHPENSAENGAWRIDKLSITNDDATLRASAWWRGGPAPETALDFALQARNAGALLARLGYPGLVAGGNAQLDGSVSWQ